MVFSFFSRKDDSQIKTSMPGLDPRTQEFNATMLSKFQDAGIQQIERIQNGNVSSSSPSVDHNGQPPVAGGINIAERRNITWALGAVESAKVAPGGVTTIAEDCMTLALTGDVVASHRGPTVDRRSEGNYTAAPNGSVKTLDRGGASMWIEGQTVNMIKKAPPIVLRKIWEKYRTTSLNSDVEDISFDDLMGPEGFNGNIDEMRDHIVGHLAESHTD